MRKVYIYKKFERFWHWTQAALIIFLAITGFEVHDSVHLFGFENAVMFHRVASYLLLGLIAFSIFDIVNFSFLQSLYVLPFYAI